MKKKLALIFLAVLNIVFCYGQNKEYVGKVVLSHPSIPPVGVQVTIKGYGYELRAELNETGLFYIDQPQYPFDVVFQGASIDVLSAKVASVADKLFILDYKYAIEVDVKRTLTGTQATFVYDNSKSVHSSAIIRPRETDINLEILMNRLSMVPGVRVFNGKISVRGSGALYAQPYSSYSREEKWYNRNNHSLHINPLLIIDGIEWGAENWSIFDIPLNVSDIKSITLVKGVDSSSYGQRGVNGVIYIKTVTPLIEI